MGGRGVKGEPRGPFDHKGDFLGSRLAWHPEKTEQDSREKDPGSGTIWLEACL